MGSLKCLLSADYLDGQPVFGSCLEVVDSSRNRIFRLRFGVLYNPNIFLYITFCMQSHPCSSSSRSLLVWCPGNYSLHLLPPGPKAAEQSTYPTSSLSGVTFPSGLGCNSFPAAANAVRQSHRQGFGWEPRVGILFPYTWPMLHLLAVSKQ